MRVSVLEVLAMQDDLNVYSVMEACFGPTVKAVLDVVGGPLTEPQAAFLLQDSGIAQAARYRASPPLCAGYPVTVCAKCHHPSNLGP